MRMYKICMPCCDQGRNQWKAKRLHGIYSAMMEIALREQWPCKEKRQAQKWLWSWDHLPLAGDNPDTNVSTCDSFLDACLSKGLLAHVCRYIRRSVELMWAKMMSALSRCMWRLKATQLPGRNCIGNNCIARYEVWCSCMSADKYRGTSMQEQVRPSSRMSWESGHGCHEWKHGNWWTTQSTGTHQLIPYYFGGLSNVQGWMYQKYGGKKASNKSKEWYLLLRWKCWCVCMAEVIASRIQLYSKDDTETHQIKRVGSWQVWSMKTPERPVAIWWQWVSCDDVNCCVESWEDVLGVHTNVKGLTQECMQDKRKCDDWEC